jgi:ubiquitin-conjugating enzyme E2 R
VRRRPRLTYTPDFKFERPLWHPNIYPDGRLCISILHSPGEDMVSGEDAGERWSPAQRAETVLISILSLLDDPEISSPANVDASVQYRDHKDDFKQRVQEEVEQSKKAIPEGFVVPTHESTKPPIEDKPDEDFWVDSDAEDLDLDDFDFDDDAANGSESDEALNNDSEDEEDSEDNRDDDTAKLDVTPKAKAKAKGKGKAESEEGDAEMTDVE